MPRGKLKSKESIIHDDFYGESILTDVSTAPEKYSGYVIVGEPVEELNLKPGDELPFSEEPFSENLPFSKNIEDKSGIWITFDVIEKDWFGKRQKVATRLRKSTSKEIKDAKKRILASEKIFKEKAKVEAKSAAKAAKKASKKSKAAAKSEIRKTQKRKIKKSKKVIKPRVLKSKMKLIPKKKAVVVKKIKKSTGSNKKVVKLSNKKTLKAKKKR